MPVTFNTNNNYDVEIITDPDVTNPTLVQYSEQTNAPFVEIKITPTNSQSQPVLASNLKIDDIISDFAWNAGVNYNTKGICEPPPPPHDANSSLQHTTGIGVTSNCQSQGFNPFFGESSDPQQGPYSAQNDLTTQTSQIVANGVSWSEIILIEVYEDDLGNLINDGHSPAIESNYNEWLMWAGPIMTQGGLRREITTNIYPIYVKAFVYLSFDGGGLAGLTTNTTLNLDIDEVEPIFGCTDQTSSNPTPGATIDDGSCILINYVDVNLNISFPSSGGQGYSSGPYTSGQTLTNQWGGSFTTTDLTGIGQNMRITSPTTVNLGSFPEGTQVTQLVIFDIIPEVDTPQNGYLRIYNYPLVGGVGANISTTPGYQQDPAGWGDAKNNLTAASLAIQVTTSGSDGSGSFGDFNFYQPLYQSQAPFGPPPPLSDWHNGPDPTGLQPSQTVMFVDNSYNTLYPNFFSYVVAQEFMDYNNPSFEQYTYFPERVELRFNVDFTVPTAYGSGTPITEININVKVAHNTERQGDFNWTNVTNGCTDPASFNYDPLANTDDGSCIPIVYGCTDTNAGNFNPNANTDDGTCTYVDDPGDDDSGGTSG